MNTPPASGTRVRHSVYGMGTVTAPAGQLAVTFAPDRPVAGHRSVTVMPSELSLPGEVTHQIVAQPCSWCGEQTTRVHYGNPDCGCM